MYQKTGYIILKWYIRRSGDKNDDKKNTKNNANNKEIRLS